MNKRTNKRLFNKILSHNNPMPVYSKVIQLRSAQLLSGKCIYRIAALGFLQTNAFHSACKEHAVSGILTLEPHRVEKEHIFTVIT